MTPTLQNRIRNEAWSIVPSYLDLFSESIEQAKSMVGVVESSPSQIVEVVGTTAVITISGAMGKRLDWFEKDYMGMTDYDEIEMALREVSQLDGIQRAVLHFDTPGGSVTGCSELGKLIKSMSLPTVAFTDSMMASAGYWLGSQCDLVYASGSSSVGSIGCYIMHVDQSGLLEKIGVKVSMFKKGKHKASFSPFKPLSDEEKKELQASADKCHGQFKAAVSASRSVDSSVFESKCYDSDEAIDLGLIDGHIDNLTELLQFLG